MSLGRPPYICDSLNCSEDFTTLASLSAHYRMNHGIHLKQQFDIRDEPRRHARQHSHTNTYQEKDWKIQSPTSNQSAG
ncbi:hypothetical protein BGZ47_007319 [Haplosporangium gracile]|nr:hypothetical protein BGZ47_007319 [Haplosporangium gracile]